MPYTRTSESSNNLALDESFAFQLFYDGCLLLFIYIVLVPLLSYVFNINITRAIAIECTLYFKFIQWLYKFVLPTFGHGMKNYNSNNINTNYEDAIYDTNSHVKRKNNKKQAIINSKRKNNQYRDNNNNNNNNNNNIDNNNNTTNTNNNK